MPRTWDNSVMGEVSDVLSKGWEIVASVTAWELLASRRGLATSQAGVRHDQVTTC
jgi:hypothetical protein